MRQSEQILSVAPADLDTSFMRNPHDHQMSDTIAMLVLDCLAAVLDGLDQAFGKLCPG